MATDVLLITEARIATVELLEQLLAHLQETTGLRVNSRLLQELQPEDFRAGTYPLIVRSINSEAYGLTKLLRRSGVQYGFYLDDNFWLLDPATELGRRYAERPERRRLESVVRHASNVIASTPLLRDYLRSRNPNVVHLDSFFDFSLIPELPRPNKDRKTVRGGFAASAHRVDDLRLVLSEVVEVLDEYPDLEFELIGINNDNLIEHPRIRHFPYRDSYADYISFQRSRQWDFALAPLGGAASNLYKSNNKYREYAAQGIPGIYQDAPPYSLVRDGETGLVAGTTRSWRDAISRYVEDPALRARVRANARKDAEEQHSLENVAPQWSRFFEAAAGAHGSTRQLERIRRSLNLRSSPAARVLRRGRLLWAYGREQATQNGLLPTVSRTAHFIWRRGLRRHRQ